jgi:hypothetical protein
MTDDALARLRSICLALPEAVEAGGVADHTFRIRKKIFAMYLDNHHGDGRLAMWCKAPAGAQDFLVQSDPERFFVPPYVGVHGWIGVHLNRDPDWQEIEDLVEEAYRMTAPKRLVAELDRGA